MPFMHVPGIRLSLAMLLGSALAMESGAALSVTRFGITWTFDRDATVGTYANGDPWVVGPVAITNILPVSTTVDGWTRNGTMVNPAPSTLRQDQGFDSSVTRIAWWNPILNVAPGFTGAPLVVQPGSSVISTISKSEPNTNPSYSQLEAGSVLTVVAEAPPAGSFRPPAVGDDKAHRWNKADLDFGVLKKLTPVPSTPPLETVEAYFERPWLMQNEGSSIQAMSPACNMPHYGRDQAHLISDGMLSLHLNYTDAQKETLYIRLVQMGIDVYGATKAGQIWKGAGGENCGRKAPMLLAGLALHDTNILEWADAQRHYVFQEDQQTFFVTQADVGRVVTTADNRPRETYRQEHVGMPEWGEYHTRCPENDGSNWNSFYRWVGGAWQGNILAIKLIPGGEAAWNWPAVFAYADRYWRIESPAQTYGPPNAITPFVCDMWEAYR
ncbi:MAG: hypothetical protein K8T26_00995 [Lentisphaerae bacterium]|nr:hypothetical protein [Lentisphaerota bacterium]